MMDQAKIRQGLKLLYGDIGNFSRGMWPKQALRPYQLGPARVLVEAVRRAQRRGATDQPNQFPNRFANQFAIVFSRQAGKDETTAQLLAYLLNLYQFAGGQIVLAAPTQRQATISKTRLLERLDNGLNRGALKTSDGYIVRLGQASARFLSAGPSSNVRGETASLLLVANEAQDIEPDRWDAVFDPMAASTNATTLFLGTVWTANTLLARQMRFLRQQEAKDGQQRVFLVDWREVAQYVPAYGERVKSRIAQFGEQHPFIKTEYLLQELDGSGGLFGPERQALMAGTHPRLMAAQEGKLYCLLVDVAGADETGEGLEAGARANLDARRDSTAVTVVEVSEGSPLPGSPKTLPTYRVVQRYLWTGVKQTELYGRLVGLARDTWRARYVVVDATGIGQGLASFLSAALPKRVIPFVFTSASKSELGWTFAGVIDSGRYKEYAHDGAADTALFWRQLGAVEYEVRPGPGQLLRWSVPDPLLHDDLVLSAALVGALEGQDWRTRKALALADRAGW
ncbi:MAG TPA: hypothetical protein VH186_01110 [Chloroflexia bacterium]|nr:hypothetical protein [Chloroflexia bacterium]